MKPMLKMFGMMMVMLLVMSAFVFAQSQEEMAEALKKMAQGTGEAKKVEVIDWKDMQGLLPDAMEGYEAGKVDGGTMSMMDPMGGGQFKYSTVTRTYKKDNKKITISIVDTGYRDMLMAPYTMAMEYDGPDGSMKSVEVNGYASKEMIQLDDGEVKSAQLMTLVHKRVLVMFEAKGEASLDEVKGIAGKFNFAKLEELAKAGDTEEEAEE